MATKDSNTNDGPGLALAVLYEANDFLTVLKEHHEETVPDSVEMSARFAAQFTLIGEIGRRLDSAISHLDGAVPHPAEAPKGTPEAFSEGSPGYQRITDLQCQLEDIAGVANITAERCEDADMPIDVEGSIRTISRAVQAVRYGLDDLIAV